MAFNRPNHAQVYGDAINTVGRDQYTAAGDQYFYLNNFSDPNAILRHISKNAAVNAFYNAEQRFPPPKCHPGTRLGMLRKLRKRIESPGAIRVLWLSGTVGVGKSAIAQTLSEEFFGSRIAAAFFFSRNDETRDKLDPLVASIVYQFSKLPSLWHVLGPRILDTIRLDPRIFDAAFEYQFQKLIIEPCSEVKSSLWRNLPNVIAIDGLDECVDHPSQERLLHIIRDVTATARSPIPWIFLICSRPEPQIRAVFDGFSAVLEALDVNSSDEANRDVERFFLDRFADLRKKHRALHHEDKTWPSTPVIDSLVERAQGQFIFATTVIKYIDTRDQLPQDRLEDVLRIYVEAGSKSPYSDLDLLYLHILSQYEEWEGVQQVLGLILTPHLHPHREEGKGGLHWRSPAMIDGLLNFKAGQTEVLLSRLHAVLYIPDDNSDISFPHASFTEFLSDTNRCTQYYRTRQMPEIEYYNCVAALLIRTITFLSPYYPPSCPQSSFSTTLSAWKNQLDHYHTKPLVRYSLQYWHIYCTAVNAPSLDLLTTLDNLDPHCLLAASLYYKYFPLDSVVIRRLVVGWAERFGERTKNFVKQAESSLEGYRIAFSPETERGEALWHALEMQASFNDRLSDLIHGLRSPYHKDTEYLDTRIAKFYRRLYHVDRRHTITRGAVLMVLSDNQESCFTLPRNWVTVRLTKDDGDMIHKVLEVLRLDPRHEQLILEDIWEDTWESVAAGLFEASTYWFHGGFTHKSTEG
ncbi:hypothetical protein VNI00_006051 [Paramarasmius palmivorus]|uniref:Nephrocystin 3-like N-terminal domain-containing protein n=1 Tax=Paramarasmius palmivorus TaxID=297713 RepID=A0AAW0DG62_9AGAR